MQLTKLQFEIARLFRNYVDRIECEKNVFHNLEIVLMHLEHSREIYQQYNFLFKLIDFFMQNKFDSTINRLMILTFELIAKCTKKRKVQRKFFKYYYYVINTFIKVLKRKWMIEGELADVNSEVVVAFGAMYRAVTKKPAFRNYLQRTKYLYNILDTLQYLDELNSKFWLSFLIEILDWPCNEPLLYTITWFDKSNRHIKSLLIKLFKKFSKSHDVRLQIYILHKILFELVYNVELTAMYKTFKYHFIDLELNIDERVVEIELQNFFKQYKTELECDPVSTLQFRQMIEQAKQALFEEQEWAECKKLNQCYRKLRETKIQANLEARLINAKFFNYSTDKCKCHNIIHEHKKKLLGIINSRNSY